MASVSTAAMDCAEETEPTSIEQAITDVSEKSLAEASTGFLPQTDKNTTTELNLDEPMDANIADTATDIDASKTKSDQDNTEFKESNRIVAKAADGEEKDKCGPSELTSLTSSKDDTGSSIEKLDGNKPTETDLESSIEVISSPIPDDNDALKDTKDSSYDMDNSTTKEETTDEPKPIEVDLDSSIEMIDSPGSVPVLGKADTEETVSKKKEHVLDSDSSIEIISSPGKEAACELIDKVSITEMSEIKEKDNNQSEAKPAFDAKVEQQPEIVECEDIAKDIDDVKVKVVDDTSAQENLLTVELEKTEKMEDEPIKDEIKTEDTEDKLTTKDIDLPEDNEIYYKKDCLNCNCQKMHKQYVLASLAALNYYRVPRKAHKRQYICMSCHDTAMDVYEDYAGHLLAKQPLLLRDFKQDHAEYVALDSSDEEESEDVPKKAEFSANDLQLIENELEDAIKTVVSKVNLEDQMTWSKTILQSKTERMGRELELANEELSNLQHMADKMHFALYNHCQVVHKHMPPLDLYQNLSDYVQVPPAGEIERPPIQINETYYAVKNKAIASWVSVKVIEFTESTTVGGNLVKSYKIKYLNTPYQMVKTVTAKHLAYFEPPPVRLTIGTRVIAYFNGNTLTRGKEKDVVPSAFYPGIIAEPLKQANRFRYLIFYDDGYTQYVQHNDVRLVCMASERVWEDVHPGSRDFIQKYVEKYSVDRPMVQCMRGQNMNTESNGTWLYARVIDVDCSLVQMQFDDDKNHTEWIYRGSLRLGPVFKETQNALNSANAMQQHRLPRRTEPFIRYTKEMETSTRQVNQQMRAIARKSSSAPQNVNTSSTSAVATASANAASSRSTVRHLNNSTIYVDDENRPKGHVVYFTTKRNLPPKVYTHHECSPSCKFNVAYCLDSYSPLSKPLLCGWERLKFKQKTKTNIVYRGPCGKTLRNLAEVHIYLRATENVLNVENFDFTPELSCLAEYSIDPTIVKEADISKGQEKMAIPLVNYYDNSLPPPCTYAKQRIPTEGVHLNLDEEFLVGCDCEDDCSDKSKCSCWQLTVAGVRYCNPNKPIEEIGYQYKRLHEHVPTGIYECNSRCKCQKNCLNRVVQHSLEMKLQVFKTSNRGWGLRCVNDIPRGAFICIYAGHMLTETMANEGGLDAGDEYFADLDYIEVAEQLKEGYESEVDHSATEEEEDIYAPDPEDDDEFKPNKYYQPRKKDKLRASRNQSNQANELDSQERAVINFNPNADLDETVRENSVRRLFGKDEAPYIMDAKTTGNLGRYFNHSCAPNLFVQNVFVDTHDLRFPWVAFFSANYIRSGTELTWNYNYEVGVVPGKVLYCQCGASNCRIRLL
ncbi:histone-lysine N-methyltransferase eggless [Drosophila albomicans]|uniref:Histone-lysine N-methyltransferase eggless n=1 Tax=Drosophila albomicans TaxID=7291 RepID=A0A6P8WU29_DROAB|nr:histone-lysine N-methyltransferase eggless [Drosophila albomicans]